METNSMSSLFPPYREAAEKEAAKQKYWKLHQEGKTDQAKSDMARLAVIRQKREEAAAQRLAEAQGKLFFFDIFCILLRLLIQGANNDYFLPIFLSFCLLLACWPIHSQR